MSKSKAKEVIQWKTIDPKKIPKGYVLGFNRIHKFTTIGKIYKMYGFKLMIKSENGNEYPITHYLDPKKFITPEEME